MNYNEQLKTQEWKSKREEIILRDNSRCTECKIERNEILGLSNGFGLKDEDDLNIKGYSVGKNNKFSNGIFLIKNNFMSVCHYISKHQKAPDIWN